jgi:hypothetical protein
LAPWLAHPVIIKVAREIVRTLIRIGLIHKSVRIDPSVAVGDLLAGKHHKGSLRHSADPEVILPIGRAGEVNI